ncbi:hypothetical protein D8682_21155 [Buttiauxella sp. 3AFRM03]|nr:hypothetical protein D8682_21155 [Buttiauxella sp. 3AFRM03]
MKNKMAANWLPFLLPENTKLKRFSVRSSNQIWTLFLSSTSFKNRDPVLPHKKGLLTKSDKIV